MADPFLAENRITPYNFAPQGWASCDGQILSISQNTALFSLLGVTYGGNGTSTFGLPNLQGAAPMDAGQGPGLSQRVLGETAGAQTVTLLSGQIPPHAHGLNGDSSAATSADPSGALFAVPQTGPRKSSKMYAAAAANTPMLVGGVQSAGGNQPHNNMQPYLVLNFIIALNGIFPQRS